MDLRGGVCGLINFGGEVGGSRPTEVGAWKSKSLGVASSGLYWLEYVGTTRERKVCDTLCGWWYRPIASCARGSVSWKRWGSLGSEAGMGFYLKSKCREREWRRKGYEKKGGIRDRCGKGGD